MTSAFPNKNSNCGPPTIFGGQGMQKSDILTVLLAIFFADASVPKTQLFRAFTPQFRTLTRDLRTFQSKKGADGLNVPSLLKLRWFEGATVEK